MKFKQVALLVVGFIIIVVGIELEPRFLVKGRVVDASTGKPIEGASVAIRWTGTHIAVLLAPYASGTYEIEKANATTDEDGYFEIPKYFLKSFDMGVYKKGYVCWSSNYTFLKGGKGRKKFLVWIRPYMKIKLEPFTAEYPRFRHAGFLESVSISSGGLEGGGEEIKYYNDTINGRNNE